MASIYYLFDDAIHIENDVVQQYSAKRDTLKEIYQAAVTVQRYYRGYLARKKIKHWNTAATRIQKHVRGWLARYSMPDLWHQEYDRRCLVYYNKMATRIQALWRGVWTRKKIPLQQILQEKREEEEMLKKMRVSTDEGMNGSGDKAEEEKKRICDGFLMEQIFQMLFDRHHLLSTCTKKGILNSSKQNQCELSEIEKVLSSISWKKYTTEFKKIYKDTTQNLKISQKSPYIFQDRKLRKHEDYLRMKYEDKKDMSLLCEVDDTYKDDKKMFVLNSKLKKPFYKRQLMTQEKYVVPEKVIVRTIDPTKNISETDFKLALKNLVKKSNVSSFYADFWFQKCTIHNIEP